MPLAAPMQRSFAFAERRERRRLARIDTVIDYLQVDEDKVLLLAMDKDLAGFDLRGPGTERRVLAVWWQSIIGYERHRDFGAKIVPCNGEDVAADIFPYRRTIPFTTVKLALGIKSQHLHNLIAAKLLTAQGGDSVNQSPEIVRVSLIQFLNLRRVA